MDKFDFNGMDLPFLLLDDYHYFLKEIEGKHTYDIQIRYLKTIIEYFLERF